MLKKKKNSPPPEISSGSMADIAFLLLIFFLVSTTIDADKGVFVSLPPKREQDVEIKLNKRNIFNVLVNSRNQMLGDEVPMALDDLGPAIKEFVLNNGRDPSSSDSPQAAVVSLKTDRGTDYNIYLLVVDEIKKAYNEMRADAIGVSLKTYEQMIKDKKASDKAKLDRARSTIPYQVSDAEPTAVGG